MWSTTSCPPTRSTHCSNRSVYPALSEQSCIDYCSDLASFTVGLLAACNSCCTALTPLCMRQYGCETQAARLPVHCGFLTRRSLTRGMQGCKCSVFGHVGGHLQMLRHFGGQYHKPLLLGLCLLLPVCVNCSLVCIYIPGGIAFLLNSAHRPGCAPLQHTDTTDWPNPCASCIGAAA